MSPASVEFYIEVQIYIFEMKVEAIYMAGMIYMRLQYIRDEVNDVNAITYDNSSHNFAALSRSCVINT